MPIRQFRIALTLAMSVGLLVLVAVGAVLYVQWSASRQIIGELGGRLALFRLNEVEHRIRGQLEPVRNQVEELARLIETDSYGMDDKEDLLVLARGSVTASPQISAVVIMDPELSVVRVRRGLKTNEYEADIVDLSSVETAQRILAETSEQETGQWGDPLYSPETERTYVNYRRPLRQEDELIGVIAAGVQIDEFSRFVDELGDERGGTIFVMQGSDTVIAHRNLLSSTFDRSVSQPTVSVSQIGDPVLSSLDRAVPWDFIDSSELGDSSLDVLSVAGERYFLLRRSLGQFGERPLSMGIYLRASEVDAPIRLFYSSGLTGWVSCWSLCSAQCGSATPSPSVSGV